MIYILPGMGATQKMYQGPWLTLPNTTFLNYPQTPKTFTLTNLAKTIIKQNNITPDDTIIGTSLGGIIAVEIAHILNSKQLFLISSAINKQEINQFLLALSPISHL